MDHLQTPHAQTLHGLTSSPLCSAPPQPCDLSMTSVPERVELPILV